MDVAVIGGGVVGVLAGIRLLEKGIDFAIFERQADFGGVWTTHGNNHSTLQVQRGCLTVRCPQQQAVCRPILQISPWPAMLTPVRTSAGAGDRVPHTPKVSARQVRPAGAGRRQRGAEHAAAPCEREGHPSAHALRLRGGGRAQGQGRRQVRFSAEPARSDITHMCADDGRCQGWLYGTYRDVYSSSSGAKALLRPKSSRQLVKSNLRHKAYPKHGRRCACRHPCRAACRLST